MDLRLTKENILDTLDKNMLDRNVEVKEFVQMLDRYKEARIIAINGAWGCGKSFFIKQVCEVLDYDYQKKRNIASEEDKGFQRIEDIISRHEELQMKPLEHCFITIYYDAWRHDDHDDPLLSLIYEIEGRYKELPHKIDTSFNDICDVLKNQIEKKQGLRSIIEAEKMKGDFRKLLDALHENKTNKCKEERVLIVIDELDRCKPDYAVKVLERIKHFIDLENVFFIYCLNKVELCKSIECFYGRGLESTMYLNKFFDITYDLNIKDVSFYYFQIIGEFRNHPDVNSVIIGLVKYLKFSLRECNQFAEIMKDRLLIKKSRNEEIWISENIFYPIIAALRISNAKECRNFLGGRSGEYLDKMYSEVKEIGQLMSKRGGRADAIRLLEAYSSLFCRDRGNSDIKKIRGELKNLLYD